MLKSRSIATQFAAIFIVSLAILATAFYFMLDRVYQHQLKSQAETVADNVDAFGAWVAQYGRVWVKDNDQSYLGHMGLYLKVAQNAPDGQQAMQPELPQVNFYSKNPALAQREYSEVVEKSASHAKFRMTSHNYMNPSNKPDPFEARALERIRAENLKEYYERLPGQFRYARTLYHKASCIGCHGEAEKAPNDVKVRYGTDRGFNFKEGDVAGIISVRVPTRPFFEVALAEIAPWQIVLVVLAFFVSYVFIRYAVVKPMQRLTAATAALSVGETVDLGVAKINEKSRNELDQLALATDRLRTSLEMAIKRLRDRKA